MTNTLGIEKVLWIKAGVGIMASGVIPHEADFFSDHFPGFPVLPGVLALEMFRMTLDFYLRETGFETHHFRFRKVGNVKFSRFLKPGDCWENRLDLISVNEGSDPAGVGSPLTEFVWNARMTHEGKTAVSARLTVINEI
ncbi:MAG: hypothetical protein EXS63_09345 [Candidatus Omnitrophica bacterium]|nr:hypothetical protein [Candidatus Omnitrophota bacterium]